MSEPNDDKTAPQPKVGRGATHVTVACKLPAGLVLRLYNMVPSEEPVLGGGVRKTTIAEYDAAAGEYRLKGYAAPHGERPDARIIGGMTGFALTPGIARDFGERWLKANADLPAVKNGLIFASDKEDHVVGLSKDQKGLSNGLEPIDPKNPPRVSRTFKVEKFTKDDEKAA
jgi:hypothetical protein